MKNKYNIGDLFIIKCGKDPDISFIITEKHGKSYKVIMCCPDGSVKSHSYEHDSILHCIRTKRFIHFPVVK